VVTFLPARRNLRFLLLKFQISRATGVVPPSDQTVVKLGRAPNSCSIPRGAGGGPSARESLLIPCSRGLRPWLSSGGLSARNFGKGTGARAWDSPHSPATGGRHASSPGREPWDGEYPTQRARLPVGGTSSWCSGTPGLWDVRALEGRVSRSGSNLVKGE